MKRGARLASSRAFAFMTTFAMFAVFALFTSVSFALADSDQQEPAAALRAGSLATEQEALSTQAFGEPLSGDELDGVKVRIRPKGSHKPLAVKDDGSGTQNCIHLYYNGKSSQFQLVKAASDTDNNSYNILFYPAWYDTAPKVTGDCMLDVDNGGKSSGYNKEGQVIHVVSGNADADNKRWQFIQQADGSYYIRNERSGQYWSLEGIDDDSHNIREDKTKLVQSKTPLKWEVEIVSDDNAKLKSIKQFDSYSFTYEDKPIYSTNWMSGLPDDLKLSDISIPGTHDAGTCHVGSNQAGMSDQRYYIDEILNAGVRHLDLRTDVDTMGNVMVVHSDSKCLNRQNNWLPMDEVMGWIEDFLEENPSETIILQVKEDAHEDRTVDKTFEKLKALAMEDNSIIWSSTIYDDSVPTLGQARGKVVVISRLKPDYIGNAEFGTDKKYYRFEKDGIEYCWALNCFNWQQSNDKATGLALEGNSYEVWTQDNWKQYADDKKDYIKAALIGNADDGYTNGTQYRYDQAKMNGKDAWIFNYTSASHKRQYLYIAGKYINTPYDISKDVQQWLIDRSYIGYEEYEDERILWKDSFTGIMAFDYADEFLAQMIYRTNFNRDYYTIRGVNTKNEELGTPLTLSVGSYEQAKNKLFSETTNSFLAAHFNAWPYSLLYSSDGDCLTANLNVNSQEKLNNETAILRFVMNIQGSQAPHNLYVHMAEPIINVDFGVTMPACGTEVSANNPGVTVSIGDEEQFKVDESAKPFITAGADSDDAFEGSVEGGKEVPIQITFEPKWGYYFPALYSVNPKGAEVASAEVTSDGLLKVKATASIPHDLSEVAEVEATCTAPGVKAHYKCAGCGKYFKQLSDGIQAVVNDSELAIPAFGHAWGEWEVTQPPTETAEGSKTRTCSSCNKTEMISIPVLGHTHDSHLSHVEAKLSTCDEPGNIEYWVCDQGDNACGCYFSDASCESENQISESETVLPLADHEWRSPIYYEGKLEAGDAVTVLARHRCGICGHEEYETVLADYEQLEPTCTEPGYRHVAATFTNFKPYENDITYQALGHDWDKGEVTLKPTCQTEGVQKFTCKRCGETKTEAIPVDENAHSPIEVYPEGDSDDGTEQDDNTATCTEGGELTQKTVCSICGKDLGTKKISTASLGHVWGDATYEWSDDKSSVTATHVCLRCDENENETVQTTVEVVDEATCDVAGQDRYTATFENEEFDEQQASAETAVLGHDWGEPAYKWSDDKSICTATRVCKRDSSHVQTVVATVNFETTKVPTATEAGERTYKATFDVGWAEMQTAIQEIEPKGQEDAIKYHVVKGGTTWVKGSGAGLPFTFERNRDNPTTFSHFTGVLVDGLKIAESAYTAQSGSVVIELKPDYLATLPAGTHKLQPTFDDGVGDEVSFVIVESAKQDAGDDGKQDDDGKQGTGDKADGNGGKQNDNSPSADAALGSKVADASAKGSPTTPKGSQASPKTGDTLPVAAVCILALVGLATAIIARRRMKGK